MLLLTCISVADDLAEGVRTSSGSVEEMAANFEGWDPRCVVLLELPSHVLTRSTA